MVTQGDPDTLVLDPLKHILGYLGERLDLESGQKVWGWHRISVPLLSPAHSKDEANMPGLLHKTSGFWAETCHDQICFLSMFLGQELAIGGLEETATIGASLAPPVL